MNPDSVACSLKHIASRITKSRNDRYFVISRLNIISSSIVSDSRYNIPPRNTNNINRWVENHRDDAIAYVADWTESGKGFGRDEAKSLWPDNPGFDWDPGLPDWSAGIKEEDGYEYRTSLIDGDASFAIRKLPDGFELVRTFRISPDFRGTIFIGEGSLEAVYRRPESNIACRLSVLDSFSELTPGYGFHLEGDGYWDVQEIPSSVISNAEFSGYLKINGYNSAVFEMKDGDQWAQKQSGTPEPKSDEAVREIMSADIKRTSKMAISPNLQRSLEEMSEEMVLAEKALDRAVQYGRRLETERSFDWIVSNLEITLDNFHDFRKSVSDAISYAIPG